MSRELEPVNRQAPHHAPDEPRARFLALRVDGHSVASASELVGCSERTGWRWWKTGREVSRNEENSEIQDDWVRVVRRSQGMQHTVLDIAEGYAAVLANDHPGPLAEIARQVAAKEIIKHAAMYNFYAGTGTDKLQKESTPPTQAQTVVFVVNVEKPQEPVIEGEVVDGQAG